MWALQQRRQARRRRSRLGQALAHPPPLTPVAGSLQPGVVQGRVLGEGFQIGTDLKPGFGPARVIAAPGSGISPAHTASTDSAGARRRPGRRWQAVGSGGSEFRGGWAPISLCSEQGDFGTARWPEARGPGGPACGP
jgi:hypothetical protein